MRPSGTDKALTNFLESLKLLKEISAATNVTFLKGAVGAALHVGQIVQKARSNQGACYELSDRINRFVHGIYSQFVEGSLRPDESIQARVTDLERHLLHASEEIQALSKRNVVRRFFSHATDAETISVIEKDIEDAIRLFEVKNQVGIAVDARYLRDESVRRRIREGSEYGGWKTTSRCLPGTRVRYIEEILQWSADIDSPSICWLTGVAGSGKTSISHEIAFRHHDEQRMYSCFFFKQDDPVLSSSAIQLLAFGLSQYATILRAAIITAMQRLQDLRTTISFSEQLELFILMPLRAFCAANVNKTITLVIDALNECPPNILPEILRAFRHMGPLLPKNVKLFVTSRPQRDIAAVMEALTCKRLHISLAQDDGDLERFLKYQLTQIRFINQLQDSWLDDAVARDARALANKAYGLFQWAVVACALVEKRYSPRDVIKRILTLKSSENPEVNLDRLYTESLYLVFPDAGCDPELKHMYTEVVGAIIAAKEPLGVPALSELLEVEIAKIDRLLLDLGCVISLEFERGTRVAHIAHPSFFDFLTDNTRCTISVFSIDIFDAAERLSLHCFNLTGKVLKCNITDAGRPELDNSDIPVNLDRHLPESLRYSCRFALVHTGTLKSKTAKVLLALDQFLNTKLLEWIEVMSLLKLVDTAAFILRSFCNTLIPVEEHEHRREILRDTIHFLNQFGALIARSAWHTYFSALPLSPPSTILYQKYSSRYKELIHMKKGGLSKWTTNVVTIERPRWEKEKQYSHFAFTKDSSGLMTFGPMGATLHSLPTGIKVFRSDESIEFGCPNLSHFVGTNKKDLRVFPLQVIPLPGEMFWQGMGVITSVTFDESGDILVAGFEDGGIKAWHTSTWEPAECNIRNHSAAVIVIQSCGSFLASLSETNVIIAQNGGRISEVIRTDFGGTRLAFRSLSPTQWISAVHCGDHIRLNFSKKAVDSFLQISSIEHTISSDGNNLVAVDAAGCATLWETSSGAQIATCQLPSLYFRNFLDTAISRNGDLFAVSVSETFIEVLELAFKFEVSASSDTSTSQVTSESDAVLIGLSFGLSTRGIFVTGHNGGLVSTWDGRSAKPAIISAILPNNDFTDLLTVGVSLSYGEDLIAAVLASPKGQGVVQVLSFTELIAEWEINGSEGLPLQVSGPKFSPDASKIALWVWVDVAVSRLLVFDLVTKEIHTCHQVARRRVPLQLIFSPDSQLMITAWSTGFGVHNLSTNQNSRYSWGTESPQDLANQLETAIDTFSRDPSGPPFALGLITSTSDSHSQETDLSQNPGVAIIKKGSVQEIQPEVEPCVVYFSENPCRLIHVICGTVTLWNVENKVRQCFDLDPTPILRRMLLYDKECTWIHDASGRRLWWTPPALRPNRRSTAIGDYGWCCTWSPFLEGCLVVLTSEQQLLIVDASEMLLEYPCPDIQLAGVELDAGNDFSTFV